MTENLDETISFFHDLRQKTVSDKSHFSRNPSSKKRGGIKTIRNFFDFETLEEITPGAALILAAEFDRAFSSHNMKPSPINVDRWKNIVYGTFFHLGFFEILGMSQTQIGNQAARRPPILENLALLKMVSGGLAEIDPINQTELSNLFDEAGADTETKVRLVSSITDAMENVVEHAYDGFVGGLEREFPRRWWISGSASARDRAVTIAIYDQGVTIPFSLPVKWRNHRSFATVLAKLGIGVWKDGNDHQAIRAALLLSETKTKLDHRGKGLHKIKEMVSQIEGGVLTIVSRRGFYSFGEGQESLQMTKVPLLGTFVELRAKF